MTLRLWAGLPLAAALLALPAVAQQSGALTVTVNGVHSDKGSIAANLCDDPKAQFPGGCATYRTLSPARSGTTTLTFTGVKPGSYALQLFHDEDGNMIPNIPPEGFGYGNDQPFPPNFEKASIKVAGDTATSVKMTYLPSFSAAPAGSKGAPAPAGVTRTDVRDDGLYGEFYVPAHDKPLPVLIILGGSEGGIDTVSRVGVNFTQNGYAVLALAYFAELGLPKTLENVPLEYFDKALDWVKKQPGIDAASIGVIGGSRGSEAALLLASRKPEIRAVMAFSPSHAAWQGLNSGSVALSAGAWTVGGKHIPFLIPDSTAYRPDAMHVMFEKALAGPARPEADIAVEKINGPILLISGKADALWPSTDMSDRIVARLKAQGFKHGVQHLSYEGAGHIVFMGDPSTPGAIAASKAQPNAMLGGTGAAGMAAWTDNWPKTLAFFDKALKGLHE